MTDRAANDATQHITAVLVRRDHAIGNQEGARADMVSNNAQRFVAQIGRAGNVRHSLDKLLEQIDFVVRVNVLQHRGDTLKAHAGIHGRLRQRFHGAVSLTVKLHKHDVPDLNVAIAVFFRATRRAAPDVVAMIVENLGARAARAGIAHLPEVVGRVRRAFVIADTDNTFARDPDFFFPDFVSFVIGFVDGHPQAIFRQVKPLRAGQQLPGVLDSVMFEVVTEAEVAQHFEEGVVAGGVTDVFQVIVLTTGAHAALRGRRAGIITLVETKEYILELVHPGVGKQQSRVIIRDQRATGDYLVSLAMEKVEKRLTDLSGALAHNYPEIKLTKCVTRVAQHAAARPG
ncbi:hypothetical protein BN132_1526 [Cronobacter turicensis 564]|nr:hypothetical protein BN132_1526 [Cronobacter turicensis 564]